MTFTLNVDEPTGWICYHGNYHRPDSLKEKCGVAIPLFSDYCNEEIEMWMTKIKTLNLGILLICSLLKK